jgi:tetratricopeptide (TPR) repeat protein
MEESRRCLEQSLALARQLGDRRREGNTLCNLGMLHLVQKRPEKSIEVSEQALRVARELGHRRLEGTVQCNLGLAYEERGSERDALSNFEAALRAVRELSDRRLEGQFLGYMGRTLARLGEFELARERLAAGEGLLRQVSDPLSLGILLCDRADCERLAGDYPAARRAFKEAKAIAGTSGAGSQSELGQALKRLEALLSERPTETEGSTSSS